MTTRRAFLRGALSAAGAAAVGGALRPGGPAAPAVGVGPPGGPGIVELPLPPLPSPGPSGIEHIVLVMMENRSFDHFLGWVPGANGRQ